MTRTATAVLCMFLMAGLALVAGCSHYSFSAAAKTHISTIAIPILENETLEYGTELGITNALI